MLRTHKYNLNDSKVIDTRISKDGQQIKRRRECLKTGRRFTTVEEILREGLVVTKSDGRREPFSREKILSGLRKACEKRPIQAEQIEILVNDVLDKIDQDYEREVPSHAVGEAIAQRLKEVDHIAYVRFASVYRDFRDIDELDAEIRSLRSLKRVTGEPVDSGQ